MSSILFLLIASSAPQEAWRPSHAAIDAEVWNEKVRRHLRPAAVPVEQPLQTGGPADAELPTSLKWHAVDDGRQRLGLALRPFAKARRAPRLGIEYNLALD